jgi:hypothetical protein
MSTILQTEILAVPPKVRLAAMILLGGWVRPTEMSKAEGMNLLNLPIDPERTLLAQWMDEAAALAKAWGVSHLPLRILLEHTSATPTVPEMPERLTLSLEHDPTELRGTAGVLRDACASYANEDWVLVANAGQILFSPLVGLANRLASLGGAVAMAAHADGNPVTLMMLQCGCLRDLPRVGYIDMKEQALPTIGAKFAIKVATFNDLICQGIRTRESYIEALRAVHVGAGLSPLAESWQTDFQICQAGAKVAPGVRLANSVVLRGATIGQNAVLVRCVAFPGAEVPAGVVLVDRTIAKAGIQSAEEVAA